jgi:hypothetical protein
LFIVVKFKFGLYGEVLVTIAFVKKYHAIILGF